MSNFTGIRMVVKSRVRTYGYDVIEMDKSGTLRNNNLKASETNIRTNKNIIGEVMIAGISIRAIKSDDTRTIQEQWNTQFNK